jgi:hypothetical protein
MVVLISRETIKLETCVTQAAAREAVTHDCAHGAETYDIRHSAQQGAPLLLGAHGTNELVHTTIRRESKLARDKTLT